MVKLFTKKMLKICLVLAILFIIFESLGISRTYAAFNVKDTFNGSIDANAKDSSEKIKEVLVDALTVVRIIGMAIALIMLIVVGIKIMTTAPAEKANIKQYSINYVIGAFILLGASGILTIVKNVVIAAFEP